MGMVFYNIGNEGSKVSINISFVFFSLMFVFLSNAVPTVQTCTYYAYFVSKEHFEKIKLNTFLLTVPSEAPVFMREHLNNWYSMKAFYFSQQVADLPLQVNARDISNHNKLVVTLIYISLLTTTFLFL